MRYLITVVIAALSLNAFGQSGVCNYPISNVPTVVLLEENGVWLSATSSDPLIWDLDIVADSIFVTSCGVYQVQELVDFGDGWVLPCAFISEIYVLNEGCTLTPDFCGEGTVWNAATSTCISANTADINNDGCVQLDDLLDLLISYGDCDAEESPWQCGDPLEYQGYDYETVLIGEQCWFSENCRYLPEVSPSSEGSETDAYYYVYGYEGTDVTAAQETEYYETFGVLYNWPAVMTAGMCPSGWHIPTDGEWQTMEISLGMSESVVINFDFRGSDEGFKMKSTVGWNNNGNGSNSSGFNGLPGGYRGYGGINFNGLNGNWWTASESESYSLKRLLLTGYDNVYRNIDVREYGLSSRCIKD